MTTQNDIYTALNQTPNRWINSFTIAERLGVKPKYNFTRMIRRLGENMNDIEAKLLGSKQMSRFLKKRKGMTPQYLGYIAIKRRTKK